MAISTNIRVGTDTNLQQGGSYDILMIKFKGDYPQGEISFGLYDVPMKITGVQKVAQTFMKILLTGKGSDPFYPNRGTFFPSLAVGSNIVLNDAVFIANLRDSVNDASNQTVECMNAYNADISSCMDKAVLLGADKYDEGFLLYVKLTTLAGEEASVAVPFPEFGIS